MPKLWPMVPLGQVLTKSEEWIEIRPDVRYRQVTVRLWGKGVVQRDEISGAEIGATRRLIVRMGQLILSRIDARNGAFGLVPASLDGAVVSQDFPTFAINKQRVLPEFLHWMSRTKSFVDLCRAASEGTTNRVRLREDRFLTTEIPLPPLDEQRRIVARIEELAALIEEARALRVKAREEAKALASRASADAFKRLDVPDDEWVALDGVTQRITKGESPRWQAFDYVDEGPLFVQSQNVLWGQLDLSSAKRIPLAFHSKLSRSQLRAGDVLINLVGASIGRAAVVPQGLGEANINQAVAVVTPKPEFDSRFLMLFLNSPIAQQILHGGKVETARANISLTDLRDLRLPVPPPDEQRRVVAYLDHLQLQVDELTALQDTTQAELDALLPSILDRAFKGEL